MGMIEFDVIMDDDLLAKTRDLAGRYFGDDSDASLVKVIEVAFKMRALWSRSVRVGQRETGEAVSTWEFPESNTNRENNVSIKNWLFRR